MSEKNASNRDADRDQEAPDLVALLSIGEDEHVEKEERISIPGLNELDSVDQAKEWLLNGKIDAKNMAKSLPYTTQDLASSNNGASSPEQQLLVQSLRRLLNDTIRIQRRGDGVEGTVMELIADRLSSIAISESWCRNKKMKQWRKQAQSEFARDLFLRCGESIDQIFADTTLLAYAAVAPPIRDALRETCQEWAQRVDEALFPSQQRSGGTFLFLTQRNPHINETLTATISKIFRKDIDSPEYWALQENVAARKEQLQEAVFLVSMGTLDALKSCWECGATSNCTTNAVLRWCSKCKVALYCGRKCQNSAWFRGHRKKCKCLKEVNDAFMESLQAVDDAHKTGTMEGIQLNDHIDFHYASMIFEFQYPYPAISVAVLQEGSSEQPDPSTLEEKPPHPSMKYFYENLGRVLRGEWWFYSCTDSLSAYHAKLRSDSRADLSSQAEWRYFDFLFVCLSYDIFGFAAGMTAAGIYSDQESSMKALFEDSLVKAARDEFGGLAMPAERFLELYKRSSRLGRESNKNVRSRLKSNRKAETLKYFRDNFHT